MGPLEKQAGSEVPDNANVKSNAATRNGLFKPEKRISRGQRLRKFFCILSLVCEVSRKTDKVEWRGNHPPGQRGCEYGLPLGEDLIVRSRSGEKLEATPRGCLTSISIELPTVDNLRCAKQSLVFLIGCKSQLSKV
jgi:hypothetical protein